MSNSSDPTKKSQIHYITNIRTALTANVMIHHTAIAFGGSGLSVYVSPYHRPNSSPTLVGLNAINQTFFMGAFFLISGWGSRVSLERRLARKRGTANDFKGAKWEWWTARLKRLGLPCLVYILLSPALIASIKAFFAGSPHPWQDIWDATRAIRGVKGPVWYTALLLIFDSIYIVTYPRLRFLSKPRPALPFSTGSVLRALAITSLADFLFRIYYPVGTKFVPLGLNVGYTPQYIVAYMLGLSLTSPADFNLSPSTTKALLVVNSICTALGLGLLKFGKGAGFWNLRGGVNFIAASYAIFNEVTGVQIGSWMISLFKRRYDQSWGGVGRYAYAAFLVHIPVSLFVELSMNEWRASGVFKTAILGPVNVVASWGVAWLITRVRFVHDLLV